VLPIAIWRRVVRLKRHWTSLGLSLLIATAILAPGAGLTGCGGKGASGTQVPKNYTLVVVATSGAVQHTSTLTLIIQ
jgi:hypothetical protein